MGESLLCSEEYRAKVEDYENGKGIYCPDPDLFHNFIRYYAVQYNINSIYGPYFSHDNLTYIENNQYNREEIKNQIFERFGHLEGDNDYEKVLDACERVSSLNYDLDFMWKSVPEAISANSGVCWHYVVIAKVLLEDAGIYTEALQGLVGSYEDHHEWMRCWIDDRWVYCDPTLYRNISDIYFDMSYSMYNSMYRLNSSMNFDDY